MEQKKVKIVIKHFSNSEEKRKALEVVTEKGLQKFNSLAYQYAMIPEGTHEIDLSTVFSNQYNTTSGYRVFEYSEKLSNVNIRPMETGYYIAEGIEGIREYQKNLFVCGYCGKQYYKEHPVYCESCLGSEYLTEKELYLLKVINIHAKRIANKVPNTIIIKYNEIQKEARKKRLAESIKQEKEKLKKDLEFAKIEYKGLTWIIEAGLDYANIIYYSHSDVFSFGWRTRIETEDKKNITRKMKDFPYTWEFNKDA